MVVFNYGDFVFQPIDSKTCRIGNVTSYKIKQYSNGVKQGSLYKGPAIIPEIAYDATTKKAFKVTETSVYCFRGCTQLNEVVLPQTLKLIEIDSFYGTGITQLTIPKNVKRLREYAFSNMFSLKTIIFEVGSKLEIIEQCAFQ